MLNIRDWANNSFGSAQVCLLQVFVTTAEVACEEMACPVDLTGLLYVEFIVK